MTFPNIVTVAAGSTSVSFTVSFTVSTTSVSTVCTSAIYTQSGGATVSANFTVNPSGSSGLRVSSVSLNPASVVGGSSFTGTVPSPVQLSQVGR